MKTLGFGIGNPSVQIPGLSFTDCVTFGKLLYPPKPSPRTTICELAVKRFGLPSTCNSVRSIFPPNRQFLGILFPRATVTWAQP